MDNNQAQKSGYKSELYTAEAKKSRFYRIAERRTNRILENLRLLGNTSNKTLYKYTDDEVNKIFKAIDEKILEIKGKFKTTKQKEQFKL